MNKCFSCKYYGTYDDGKFSFPICKIQIGLKEATEVIKKSENCKHFNNKFDFTKATNGIKALTKAIKKQAKQTQRMVKKIKKRKNKLKNK